MSNDLIMMGVVIVLFGLYFTLQVSSIKSEINSPTIF